MEPDDPDRRDSLPLRGAKFASIIIVLALLGGGALGFLPYADVFTTNRPSRHHYVHSDDILWTDTWSAMKWRFAIGAAAGALGGLAYVIRCLCRHEDP